MLSFSRYYKIGNHLSTTQFFNCSLVICRWFHCLIKALCLSLSMLSWYESVPITRGGSPRKAEIWTFFRLFSLLLSLLTPSREVLETLLLDTNEILGSITESERGRMYQERASCSSCRVALSKLSREIEINSRMSTICLIGNSTLLPVGRHCAMGTQMWVGKRRTQMGKQGKV